MSSRARKVGDAAATERKLEEKYDLIESEGTPKAVVDWIHIALEGAINPIPKCVGYTWQDIQTYLKDGVVLCMLVNRLLTAAGKPTIEFKSKAKSAFVAMNNVQAFNDGCRGYGVPETELFQTADLVEGRKAQMVNVVSCLNKLGFVSKVKEFTPEYNPPAAPKADY